MEMPKFLLSKKFLYKSVLIIFAFSIPFMLVYRPFSATTWFGFTSLHKLAYTSLFYALSISFMFASKRLMHEYQLSHTLSLGRFIAWILAEYVSLAVIYIFLTPHASPDAIEVSLPLVLRTALCVGLILIIPYSFLALYAAYKAQKEELEMLRLSIRAEHDEKKEKIVQFYDYKGDMAISIPESSIFYMAAQDNYVQVFYEVDGKMLNYMLRCPTQKLESMMEGTALVRCHRSFIVNLRHLKCFKRGHNRATIELGAPGIKEIPVSKSYYKRTLERLTEVNPSADSLIMRT